MTIAIVTDSASDLGAQELDGVTVVPLHLHFGDDVYEDGVNLKPIEFWQRLERVVREGGELPTTSQPSPGAFRDIYQQLIDEGVEGIVSVHLSSKLSGTFNSAQQGASLIEGRTPIQFVDTLSASLGVGWAAAAARSAAQSGASVSEAASAARDSARRTRAILFVETLDYLLRGGRIGRARQLAGRLLRMRPLLELIDGEVSDLERPRTRKKAIDRLFAQIMAAGEPDRVAILHGQATSDAQALASRVSDAAAGIDDVSVLLASPVLGAHIGPGTVGAIVRYHDS